LTATVSVVLSLFLPLLVDDFHSCDYWYYYCFKCDGKFFGYCTVCSKCFCCYHNLVVVTFFRATVNCVVNAVFVFTQKQCSL